MKILIAVDDSPESRNAAETACELFGLSNDFTVVSVGDREPYVLSNYDANLFTSSAGLAEALDDDARRRAQQAAHKARQKIPVEADLEVELGTAGATICKVASESNCDVIVIGSHDRNFWERIFDPSVGRYLLENAPCPVLVVR